MQIVTKFELGDVVYVKKYAQQAKLIAAIVEKIVVEVFSPETIVISYQLSSTDLFHNSIFYEQDLVPKDEANSILRDIYGGDMENLQLKIDELSD